MPLAKSQNKENFSQKKHKKRKNDTICVSFFPFFMHKGPFLQLKICARIQKILTLHRLKLSLLTIITIII